MTIKNKITIFLFIISATFYGQEIVKNNDSIIKQLPKISYLDSIKSTFVNDKVASRIDSLWMQNIASLDGFNEMILDIKNVDLDQKVDYELSTDLLKERLKKMDEKSPFHIEYNIGLENVIKSFLKNRKKGFEKLLGISQYYFPLFEEELSKNNVPLEIKYLAVIESALNPKAVSRVGATGLWQFMFHTGKQYGLNIDSYVDERSDPLKSSQVASQYLNNMYKIFGDWDLVLAAYNSGPGNVAKAIRRSGGQQNYWNIRKNLPKETQGYLPAFLATMYIFEYHKEHGIVPNKAIANLFATDTVLIKKNMTFKQISSLLNIPVAEIQFFNPSYRRSEIPHIGGQSNFLRLPKDKIAVFTSNENKIYAYIDHEENKRERPNQINLPSKHSDSTRAIADRGIGAKSKIHKVRQGDNLKNIADQYAVSVEDIKKWNHLKSNMISKGIKLKIRSSESIATKDKNEIIKPSVVDSSKEKNIALVSKELKTERVFKTEKVVTYKEVTKKHKVTKGDNLGEIASKYNVTVAELKKWNKLKTNNIALGASIKIIQNEKVTTVVKKEVKQPVVTKNEDIASVEHKNSKSDKTKKDEKAEVVSKTENYYVVSKGDNLFTIAKKNNVTVENIKEWNNLIDNNVKIGTQLIVSTVDAVEEKTENSKSKTKNIEHVVVKGEYLGTIARKYNVSVNNILEWNTLSDTNIKLGDKLIVGKEEIITDNQSRKNEYSSNDKKTKENLYQVRKGDTLLKISQKFPGVSIADIKKWNNIKGESIKPGMKLKING